MLTKPNGSVDKNNAMQPIRDALYLRGRAVNLLTSANTLAWLHFDAEEGGGDGEVNGDGGNGGDGEGGSGGGVGGGDGEGDSGGGSDVTSPEKFMANGGGSAAGVGGAPGGPVGGSGSAGTAMSFEAVAASASEMGSEDWPSLEESNERRRLARGAGAAPGGGGRASGASAEVNMAVMTTGRPGDSPSLEPHASSTYESPSTVSDSTLLRAAATAVHNAAASCTTAPLYAPAATRSGPPGGASAGAATAQSYDTELEDVLLGDLYLCDAMDVATDADADAAGVGAERLRKASAGDVSLGAGAGRGGGPGGATAGRGVARRRFERTEGLLVEKRVWDERGEESDGKGSPKRKQPPSSLPHDTRQVQARVLAAGASSEAGLPGPTSRGRVSEGGRGGPGGAGQQKHSQPRKISPLLPPAPPPPTHLPQDAQERGGVGAATGGLTSPTAGKRGRTELGQSAAAAQACGPRDASHQPLLNAGLFNESTSPPFDAPLLPETAMSGGSVMSTDTKSPAEAAVEAVAAAVAASGDETSLTAEEAASSCKMS